MDFEKIYNDNQFQSSVVPQGFALIFLGKDQNGNIVQKFKNSKGQFGVIAGSGISQDTVTGYIINNDDGTVYFQQVTNTENGFENIGEPKAIQSVFIPETGVDEPKYQTSSQASCDFYRCASIAQGEQYYEVSHASQWPDCNGKYYLTDLVCTEDKTSPVWKHESNDLYLYGIYDMNVYLSSNYDANGNFYRANYSGGTFPESGWEDVDATEYDLQVSLKTSAPTEKTWDGYKAVKIEGFYTFEDTLTTGLSYGIITPLVDSIYNSDATVRVSSLLTAFPETGITFFNELSSADGWRFSGAEIVQDDNRSVFQTSGGRNYAVWEENPGVPLKSSPRTMSFWYKRTANNGGWCGIGYGTSGGNSRFTASFKSDYPGVTLWADDYFQSSVGLIPNNTWQHYVYTYDGKDVVTLYVDTKKVWEWSTGTTNTSWQYIHVGDPWENYANTGRFADLYTYDRILESYEIAQLYNHRTV